ncbi:MAG: DUF4080 domain-containing protein [Lachnospiraceae bacterium]|jgi:radical SAM superfamily enzyme YgiQ (UPF0313 family)|nr:DUF4080 domain-containing protein [Lachnospiraceae bacterium]
MKILLVAINSKYIHTNAAVYSLRAHAMQALASENDTSTSIDIVEYTINDIPDDILADIFRRHPDVIAFSCYIWNRGMVGYLLTELPKILPETVFWLGGPEMSGEGAVFFDHHPNVKAIIIGEGELSFTALVTGKPCHHSLTELNELPFSCPELQQSERQNKIIYYESTRGCLFNCSYCLSASEQESDCQTEILKQHLQENRQCEYSDGRPPDKEDFTDENTQKIRQSKIRAKSLEKVKGELSQILAQDFANVKFVDRTFNYDAARAMEIWQFLRDYDNKVTRFHFEIAADLLNDRQLHLLKDIRPGLMQFEIGVQSTHLPTLIATNRRMDFEHLRKMVLKLTSGGNIHIHLDLIAGLPYEDYSTFANSFNDVYALHPHHLQLGFLKVLPGTPLRRTAAEFGIIYTETPPYQVLTTPWLSFGELERLRRIAEMVTVFYNSKQFTHTISVLELAFASPFHLYEQLADYFMAQSLFMKKLSRPDRYQALFSFACLHDGKNADCYRELLTHDMCLREKMKKIPDFVEVKAADRAEKEPSLYSPMAKEYLTKLSKKRMMGVGVYCYHVEAKEAMAKLCRVEKPQFILYDYEDKDVLSGNVRFEVRDITPDCH